MNRNHLSRDYFDLLWSIIFHDSDHESFFYIFKSPKTAKKYQNKKNEKFQVFGFIF